MIDFEKIRAPDTDYAEFVGGGFSGLKIQQIRTRLKPHGINSPTGPADEFFELIRIFASNSNFFADCDRF